MRLFELLAGDDQPPQPSQHPETSPMMANPVQQPSPTVAPQQPQMGSGASQQPMQTAGLWDMAKDFMSTPQPIGGTANAATPPKPPAPTPGQPPAQSSGMISRPFGNTAVGQNLDAINKGLQPPK